MLSTDQGHVTKYMTTLGVAMVAGTLTLAGLFLRVQEALLLPQGEIELLTPLAQSTMTRRQGYLDVATSILPYFVAVGTVAGLLLVAAGLFGWMKRQRISDTLEDIALEKGKAEASKNVRRG